MTEKALAQIGNTAMTQVKFDDVIVTKQDIINYLCPQASEKEIFMALGIMASFKLNPFKREVHLIKYQGSPAEVIVGYETYLKRAQRVKDFQGKSVLRGWKAWIDKTQKRAYCEIIRSDWEKPFEWYVELSEFDKKRATWVQIPDFMGKKVAIAQAFRLAFPDELGGMPYTKEEHEVYDIAQENSQTAETRQMPQATDTPAQSDPVKLTDEQASPDLQAQAEQAEAKSQEPGKPIFLSVAEALEQKSASAEFDFTGSFVSFSERKTTTNKTVFDCIIYDLNCDVSMLVSSWKKPSQAQGEVVVARKTKPYVFKNGDVKYSCERIDNAQ